MAQTGKTSQPALQLHLMRRMKGLNYSALTGCRGVDRKFTCKGGGELCGKNNNKLSRIGIALSSMSMTRLKWLYKTV